MPCAMHETRRNIGNTLQQRATGRQRADGAQRHQVHAEYDAVVGNLRDILQRFRTEKEASDRQACSARPGPGQG